MKLHTVSRIKPYLPQFRAVFTASLAVVANGIEYTWPSPAVPLLKTSFPEVVSHEEVYWIQSLYIFGGSAGLVITYLLVDLIGRKKSILLGGCMGLICWIGLALAKSVTVLYIIRFCSGVAANIEFVVIPMYTAEISEPHIRGFFGTFTCSMPLIGALLAYGIVPYMPIYASSIIGGIITLIMIITFYWQPESPYYLLLKEDKEAAKKALIRLRYNRDVEEELKSITEAVERQDSEKGRFIDLLIVPSNRKALVIMFFLCSAHIFIGLQTIQINIQEILELSGTPLSAEVSAIFFGVAMLVSTLIGSVFIDMYGRKVFLISSSISSGVCLGILAIYFYLQLLNYDVQSYNWIPLLATTSSAIAYSYGIGLVPIVVSAELFPTSVKAKGMCLSDLYLTGMGALCVKVYHYTMMTYGMYFPFFIFSMYGFIITIFFVFYVPETKGKTLEEIQLMLKGQSLK